jgi:hypothetical protein
MRRFSDSWNSTLAKLGWKKNSRRGASRRGGSHYRRPLRMEPLEDRRLLATLIVNTNADTTLNDLDNVLSLREAILAVNNGNAAGLSATEQLQISGPAFGTNDTIQFAPSLNGQTISLVGALGEMPISKSN